MKIVTISQVGYNHLSQANWSYGIYKIDLIDTEQKYCMSHTIKENFGGDDRLRAKVKEQLGIEMIETKSVYTSTGTQKITGVAQLWDAGGKEIFDAIAEFIK